MQDSLCRQVKSRLEYIRTRSDEVMTTLSPTDLGAMLRQTLENDDIDKIDTLWWIVDELEGKHEDASA